MPLRSKHIRTKQAEMQSTKKTVMQLLGWSDQEYAEHQYKAGCNYLQAYIPKDPQGIDMLVKSKTYWNWWRNQWHQRDLQFLQGSVMQSKKRLTRMYHELHSPTELAKEIHLNGVVLGETYAQMIGQLHDQHP
jgi:hypothetical protein